MRHNEGQVQTADGVSLYSQSWLPDGEMKAVVAFSHGQAEHSGRYDHVGRALAGAGYGLVMADLRGHGRSPGIRGHVMRWQEYLYDYDAVITAARQIAPQVPLFIGGHSMGGLIALSKAVSAPPACQGVVVSGAALRLAFDPPAWKVAVGRLLSSFLPSLTLSTGLDANGLSHDRTVVDAYVSDPLVHDRVSTRGYTEIMAAQAATLAGAAKLTLPLLILHGGADSIAHPEGSREFYQRAGSTDKILKVYEGLYHEILNEYEKEAILGDILTWLDAHL
ncbi:MAG: alpha/beta hydrolase [Anaerolineae bacterium]